MGSALSVCCPRKPDLHDLGGFAASIGGGGGGGGIRSTWRIFTYKELHAATKGFSEDNKLGEGGFGSVYWGQTADGLQIAVKKLKAMNSKAEMEFAVEVEVLGRVRHKNLLGLRGYCVSGADQRLIVYDYMPNLSVLSHLHGQFSGEAHLHWRRRIKVILGSAEGLLYLHEKVSPHIIHRDIKASNVLLDSDFEPLVADFGFAKLVPEGVSHMTTRVKGTLGYLAPEYAMWGKVSQACDVYSFGILILEVVSGRKPIEKLPGGVRRTITEWAEPLISGGRLLEIADPRLEGDFDEQELRRTVAVAALCVQPDPERRLTMREVVLLLRGATITNSILDDEGIRFESVRYSDELLARAAISDGEEKEEEEDQRQPAEASEAVNNDDTTTTFNYDTTTTTTSGSTLYGPFGVVQQPRMMRAFTFNSNMNNIDGERQVMRG